MGAAAIATHAQRAGAHLHLAVILQKSIEQRLAKSPILDQGRCRADQHRAARPGIVTGNEQIGRRVKLQNAMGVGKHITFGPGDRRRVGRGLHPALQRLVARSLEGPRKENLHDRAHRTGPGATPPDRLGVMLMAVGGKIDTGIPMKIRCIGIEFSDSSARTNDNHPTGQAQQPVGTEDFGTQLQRTPGQNGIR